MPYLIESLEIADNPIVLFRGVVGSRAYGTQNANSDTDVRGIFVVPSAEGDKGSELIDTVKLIQ